MLDLSKYKKEYMGVPEPITSASILLTHDCNLRCTYCFEEKEPKKMSMEVLRKSVEFLMNNAVEYKRPSITLGLFGGEPMLCPDLIEEAVCYGYELGQKTGVEVGVSMITNGTILQPRMIKLMEECIRYGKPIGVQLSVDGPPEIQNEYRITKAGGPSMHLVEKNVPIYKEIYKGANKGNINVHGCINRKTMPHLFESYSYFKEQWGMDMLWFIPVCEEKWEAEDVNIYDREMGKIHDYIMKKVRETGSIYEAQQYAPLNKALEPVGPPHSPCGAGKTYCTITADGELWPCHHFMFIDKNREMYMGNIFEGVDENKRRIFTEYDASDMRCKDCSHTACYRCLAVNYKENGNMFCQVRGHYCSMMKVDEKYQTMMRKELNEMGIINNSKQGPVKGNSKEEEDFIAQCVKVYQDFGDCHIVDLGKKENSKGNIRDAMNQDNNRNVLDVWVENGVRFEKVREADGSINVYDHKLSEEPTAHEPKVGCEPKKACNCGNKKETITDDEDFKETITQALTMILQKVDNLERIVKDKLK